MNQKGFTLIFSILILAAVSAFSIFFLIAGRHAMMIAKEYFYGTQARYLAEAGEETIKARIQMDVLRKPLIDMRLDGDKSGSWAEDIDVVAATGVLNQHYSTRHDSLDQNASGTADEATEIQPIGGATTGFYAVVRDLARGLDLNLASPDVVSTSAAAVNALKYGLARFPAINEISGGADTLAGGGLVDAILTFRTTLGGRYRSVEQLRSVPGMTETIYQQIKNYLTVHTNSKVISGGLIAHYYDDITGYPNNVAFDLNSYAGTVLERGVGGYRVGGGFVFSMNSARDFEGTQVDPSSFTPQSHPRTYSRPGVIVNDASAGSVVTDTTLLTFGVRWEGFIYIPEDAYTSGTSAPVAFRMRATGGARMKIAGQPVVTTDQLWDSEHDGTAPAATTDYIQVSLPSGTFGIGWQPIEIEYWCKNHVPTFLLFWNEGFHFRPGSTGDPADPDVDMGAQAQHIASRSLGYKAGGVYEIRSSGVVLNAAGGVETERIVYAGYQLFDFFQDNLRRNFEQGTYSAGQISTKDSYPVRPPNNGADVNETFKRTGLHLRNYDTIANAVKPGYWSNFDEGVDDTFPGWKTRNAETTAALQDIDGDGDRELVITSNDTLTTDPYVNAYNNTTAPAVPAIDLVGPSGTLASPDSAYAYRYFFLRFRDYQGRGPIDQVAAAHGGVWNTFLEDYQDPVTTASNFNEDSDPNVPAPDGLDDGAHPGFKVEDRNQSGTISNIANNDGPHSYWVGQPLFHRTDGVNGDYIFFLEQYQPGASAIQSPSNRPSPKTHFGFRYQNGKTGINMIWPEIPTAGVQNPDQGYTYAPEGKEWLTVNGITNGSANDLEWFYQSRPQDVGSGMNWVGFSNSTGINANMTIGYRSIGNESTFPRAIDNVRIIPATPHFGAYLAVPSASFTSHAFDAGANVNWGIGTWVRYPRGSWFDGTVTVTGDIRGRTDFVFDTGTLATLTPATSMSSNSPRGGTFDPGTSMDGKRYARYKVNFFYWQDSGIAQDDTNDPMIPPYFEQFTITYLPGAKNLYLREAAQGD